MFKREALEVWLVALEHQAGRISRSGGPNKAGEGVEVILPNYLRALESGQERVRDSYFALPTRP